jgi:glycine/D-amino acid oxidase-like deaminating enzyme
MEAKHCFDFIIVGGGCIGASTAIAVKRQWPDSEVAWYTGAHKHEQLIIAAGGSYHSYKFLPIIGKMVVHRIGGQEATDPVERTLLERWSWERSEGTTSVHPI